MKYATLFQIDALRLARTKLAKRAVLKEIMALSDIRADDKKVVFHAPNVTAKIEMRSLMASDDPVDLVIAAYVGMREEVLKEFDRKFQELKQMRGI
jgi:hypothetical protein